MENTGLAAAPKLLYRRECGLLGQQWSTSLGMAHHSGSPNPGLHRGELDSARRVQGLVGHAFLPIHETQGLRLMCHLSTSAGLVLSS